MPESIHLCTCGDAPVRVGLHVMLSSALRHLAPGWRAEISVVDLGFAAEEEARLHETLRHTGREYTLRMVPADLAAFTKTDGLHRFYGSWAPYAKLLLGQFLPGVARAIYLDTDTVVCTDLATLFQIDLGDKLAGCVVEGPISQAIEGAYFQKHGFAADGVCFNSGVMLLDLDAWRRAGLTAQAIDLVQREGGEMLSADQTALNVLLRGRYLALPREYNQLAYPSSRAIDPRTAQGIWHLVGPPKPWDLFGEWVNAQAPFFGKHLAQTSLANWRSWKCASPTSIKRMARLARSYWKAVATR